MEARGEGARGEGAEERGGCAGCTDAEGGAKGAGEEAERHRDGVWWVSERWSGSGGRRTATNDVMQGLRSAASLNFF